MCTIGASVLLKTVWLMSPDSKKIDARRSADAYWEKWLAAASLRPDLQRLAMQSLPPEERPKTRRRKSTNTRRYRSRYLAGEDVLGERRALDKKLALLLLSAGAT